MKRWIPLLVFCLCALPQAALAAKKLSVTLYFPDKDANGFQSEERMLLLESGEQIERAVLWELARGPETKGSSKVMNKYFEPLSVEVKRVVYLNFPRRFYEKNRFGTTGETFLIGSIVNSLLELPGIEGVQFLVDGEVEEAAFGHICTDEPFWEKFVY